MTTKGPPLSMDSTGYVPHLLMDTWFKVAVSSRKWVRQEVCMNNESNSGTDRLTGRLQEWDSFWQEIFQTPNVEKKQRDASDSDFKSKAVNLACKKGNRAASRTVGIQESMVRCWRHHREKNVSQRNKTKKALGGNTSGWAQLEDFLDNSLKGGRLKCFYHVEILVKLSFPKHQYLSQQSPLCTKPFVFYPKIGWCTLYSGTPYSP